MQDGLGWLLWLSGSQGKRIPKYPDILLKAEGELPEISTRKLIQLRLETSYAEEKALSINISRKLSYLLLLVESDHI